MKANSIISKTIICCGMTAFAAASNASTLPFTTPAICDKAPAVESLSALKTTGITSLTIDTLHVGSSSIIDCKPVSSATNVAPELHSDLNSLCFKTPATIAPIALDYSGPSSYSKPGCDPVSSASSATPEPGTLALLSLPLIGLSLMRRKRPA